MVDAIREDLFIVHPANTVAPLRLRRNNSLE
jgi:hypothetical protein